MLELGLPHPPDVDILGEADRVELSLFAHVALQAQGLGQEGQALAPLQGLGCNAALTAAAVAVLEAAAERRARAEGGLAAAACALSEEGPSGLGEHRGGN